MTQSDLNRAVSRATGETITEIAHRGFSLAEVPVLHDDGEEEQVSESDFLCWDELYDAPIPRWWRKPRFAAAA